MKQILAFLMLLLQPLSAQDDSIMTLSDGGSGMTTVALTPTFIYTGSNDGLIRQWDRFTGSLVASLTGHSSAITALHIDNNALIHSGSTGGELKRWSLSNGSLLWDSVGNIGPVRSIQTIEPFLFTASDKFILRWSSNGTLARRIQAHDSAVLSMVVSPNRLIYTTAGSVIKVWESTSLRLISVFGSAQLLCFSISLYSSHDESIFIWNANNQTVRTIDAPSRVKSLLATSDGIIYSVHGDTIIKWNVDGTVQRNYTGHESLVRAIAKSIDQYLYTVDETGRLKVWSTCPRNYFQRDSSCYPCPDFSECTASGFTCLDNYYSQGDTCYACPLNAKCTTNGFLCDRGYYKSSLKCIAMSHFQADSTVLGIVVGVFVVGMFFVLARYRSLPMMSHARPVSVRARDAANASRRALLEAQQQREEEVAIEVS